MSSEFQAGVRAGEQAATIESLSERITALEGKVEKVLERVTLARGGIAVLIAIGSFLVGIAGAMEFWWRGRMP